MNETSAKEWFIKAWHNLSTAKILYDADHYTDIIAVELHYSVEKSLKAFLAYENKKIPKTHDINEVYQLVKKYIILDDHIDLLNKITQYHIREAYPTFDRILPSKEEIKEALDFTEKLFDKVCKILDVDKKEVMK